MEENTSPVQPKADEKPQPTPEEIAAANAKKKKNTRIILWVVFICIIIIIPASIYLAMRFKIDRLKEKQQTEIAGIVEKATTADSINTCAHLTTIARVLSFAMRSELTRANLDEAGQYITELVKTKGYKQIVLIAADGKVILSTDKKYEGENFLTLFTDQVIGGDVAKIIPQQNGDLMACAPVMGVDKRLGTVVLTYTHEPLNLVNEPKKE